MLIKIHNCFTILNNCIQITTILRVLYIIMLTLYELYHMHEHSLQTNCPYGFLISITLASTIAPFVPHLLLRHS